MRYGPWYLKILKRDTTAQLTTHKYKYSIHRTCSLHSIPPEVYKLRTRETVNGRMNTTENNRKIFLDKTNGLRAEQCRVYTG
jgi:hypothetical protein